MAIVVMDENLKPAAENPLVIGKTAIVPMPLILLDALAISVIGLCMAEIVGEGQGPSRLIPLEYIYTALAISGLTAFICIAKIIQLLVNAINRQLAELEEASKTGSPAAN